MSNQQSTNGRLSIINRSSTVDECEKKQTNDDRRSGRSESNPEGLTTIIIRPDETSVPSGIAQSNSSIESNRLRSKTASTNGSGAESTTSIGFNILQSIKDLTHQELYRANPLGLLGKEVISVTGTTHCPEPIPPKESDETITNMPDGTPTSSSNKLTPIDEDEPQHVHFPLNEEEKIQMQRRRSTLTSLSETTAFSPYPAEFMSNTTNDDDDFQPHLFTQPSASTMVADFIPDKMTINVFEVFIYAWGVFAFFIDMVTDLVLAHAYYVEGAYWLFILTLMCVIVPNLTLSIFSLVWYIDGSQLKSARDEKQTTTQCDTSMYETNVSDDVITKDPRRNSKGSELIPLHEKQNSVSHTDSCHEEDQLDEHILRLRNRAQILDKDVQQQQEQYISKRKHFQFSAATANVLTWIIRIIILVLQLDLCLKYIRGLYYTWKGFQKRNNPKWARFYLTKQILIDADIALLRVFDCFMDSGSQVTLQLYIMLRLGSTSMKFDTLFLKQCLSIVSSLGSLAYALSGYSRCWRHMQLTHSPQGWPKGKPSPQLVSWWSTIIQFIWYLFLITPRVLALAMFAATFRSWFWIIIVAHWCGMLFWILRFRTIFCITDQTKYNPREAIFEKCYNLVCSYIFIFCYMNLRKGDTRTHYIGFYTIYYIENIAFSIIYAIHSAETNLIFKYSLVSFVCCGFWLAILFQFLYYRFLHPSEHVRLSTKRNMSSIVHMRTVSHCNHIKKSKSCEEMITHNDIQHLHENNELIDTTSLQLDIKVDERFHNRFSKGNRQKLILQQQVIDQRAKLTRAQKQKEEALKRQRQPPYNFLTRLSRPFKRPTTISASLMTESSEKLNNNPTQSATIHTSEIDNQLQSSNILHEPYTKINQEVNFDNRKLFEQQQQSKMYNINEDTPLSDDDTISHANNVTLESGDGMILTASKLTSHITPSTPSSASVVNNTTSSSSSTIPASC
ncbi:unnamed protein product [Adineta steineri]|uniref:XK-related protein n=1 Tax=Adineta steineri TaxID=433720 RepID=A0A815HZT5_9BILA|nr:unnamed protein product [Adineta steineri]CAF1600027.1 unnamed protein product [Adineta steineri]